MTKIFKMATLIERIAKLSLQTFQRSIHDKAFNENFYNLKQLVKLVKATDLNFRISLLQSNRKFNSDGGQNPVTYISICENDIFSMGIFIIKNGACIPLHDHPGMFGICKVIYGNVIVESYSAVTDDKLDFLPGNIDVKLAKWQKPILVTKRPVLEIGITQEPCVLTPVEGNFHEIRSHAGPAAFLDILAPPYDPKIRDCHFYREIQLGNVTMENKTWILEIPSPSEFKCDEAPYEGPPIKLK